MIGAARTGNGNLAHFGAALLAGWWFERDHGLGDDVAEAMARQADLLVERNQALFQLERSPAPQRSVPDPERTWSDLVSELGGQMHQVWAIGHDAIFVTLALRTLKERPELTTADLVDGLRKVLAWCRARPIEQTMATLYGIDVSDVRADQVDLDASVDMPAQLARLALETLIGFERVHWGVHQGNIGHIMDHAQALLELERLGFADVARTGWTAFRKHVAVLRRLQELTLDQPEVDRVVLEDPRGPSYWALDLSWNNWAYGHAFKYPYHLHDLARLIDDRALLRAAAHQLGRLV
jgi:hypothetical protein